MEFSKPSGSAFPAPRRVFTAPTHSGGQDQAASSRAADSSVDTLYDHPSIKIVSFTAASRPSSISPRSGIPGDVEPGTLSWSSPLERTIAVGAFRIYRAPGSVAFLSCGSALQPILPKSQVWCVDETSSKFVLQIRRPQYWRIELPVADPGDLRRAELLREVFDKILQFEKTECPFKRTFTVDLPELQTPIIKRPWTPAPGSCSLPSTPGTPAEIARLHRGVVRGGANSQYDYERSMSFSRLPTYEHDRNPLLHLPAGEATLEQRKNTKASTIKTETQRDEETALEGLDPDSPLQLRPSKMNGFQASRSMTAPPQLALLSTTPADPTEADVVKSPPEAPASQSSGDSRDSFHTPQPFHSAPLPPSPPLSNPGSPYNSSCPPEMLEQPEEATNQEDVSDTTVISNASQTWSTSPIASAPSELSDCATTPSSVYDVDNLSICSATKPEEQLPAEPASPRSEEEPLAASMSAMSLSSQSKSSSGTPRRPYIRHRATTSSSISADRKMLSPLPPAANLFSPRQVYSAAAAVSASKLAVVRRLPMVVIQKTCEILMSPPSHLINLMLNVAARIAAGEWRGLVFGTDERGEQIPVHWDWSEEEDSNNNNNSSQSEGEYVGSGRQQYIDDDWPPRTGRKMAGSFPESDDEDSHSLASPVSEMRFSPVPDEVRHEEGAESSSRNPDLESDWSRSLGVD